MIRKKKTTYSVNSTNDSGAGQSSDYQENKKANEVNQLEQTGSESGKVQSQKKVAGQSIKNNNTGKKLEANAHNNPKSKDSLSNNKKPSTSKESNQLSGDDGGKGKGVRDHIQEAGERINQGFKFIKNGIKKFVRKR